MDHKELTVERSEQIMLYALKGLDDEATKEFTAHMDGCAICRQELHEMQATLGVLGYAAPAVVPPAGLKARLLAGVQAVATAAPPLPLASPVPNLAALVWEPSEYPGVSFHWLRQEATGTVAAFVKIQPGCHYAAHRHLGGEDCLVLQGGFRDRRGEYHAGDFVYYEPGSVHHDFQALAGEECLLFVVAHGGMELLAAE
jgi:anti-sigma factor ChrR (cupin superfamily)